MQTNFVPSLTYAASVPRFPHPLQGGGEAADLGTLLFYQAAGRAGSFALERRTTMYTVKYAEEWGCGGGINGTGKRQKVYVYWVVTQRGRKARPFKARGKNDLPRALIEAEAWAKHLNEVMR